MIDKALRLTAVISIILMMFILGFAIGRTPTTKQQREQAQQARYRADFYTLSADYARLYQMCEDKYQAGISGQINQAYQIKGQMLSLEAEVTKILAKYSFPQL
jgi:uncharacterized protein YpmB